MAGTKMKLLFAFIFLISSLLSFAQGIDQKVVRSEEVFYSKLIYQRSFPGLNAANSFNLNSPPEMVGFSINTCVTNNKYTRSGWPFSTELSFIITDEINYSDSIKCNLNGYVFGLGLFGIAYDIFKNSDNIDFILSPGFNFGRLRLSSSQFNQRNSLLAPKISVQFRVKIKKLAISLSGEYQFDISNQEWHKLHFGAGQTIVIQKFKQSGFFFRLSLGRAH